MRQGAYRGLPRRGGSAAAVAAWVVVLGLVVVMGLVEVAWGCPGCGESLGEPVLATQEEGGEGVGDLAAGFGGAVVVMLGGVAAGVGLVAALLLGGRRRL